MVTKKNEVKENEITMHIKFWLVLIFQNKCYSSKNIPKELADEGYVIWMPHHEKSRMQSIGFLHVLALSRKPNSRIFSKKAKQSDTQ